MVDATFFPGAGGLGAFWAPVAERLASSQGKQTLLDWPGFGEAKPDPGIRTVRHLADYALQRMSPPSDVIAQSMGGVIAVMLALDHPSAIHRLILCCTSGGIDLTRFAATNWRKDDESTAPQTRRILAEDETDIESRLSEIHQRTLLLWGEKDELSPVAVGEFLQAALPDAKLVTIPGAGHDVAVTHSAAVAEAIGAFLYD